MHNTSYHMTPGGWIMDAGPWRSGCAVLPPVGNTEQQIAAMHDLKPVAYTGTPSFLRILLERRMNWARRSRRSKGIGVRRILSATVARDAEVARHRLARRPTPPPTSG